MNKILLIGVFLLSCHLVHAQSYSQTRTASRLYMAKPEFWPNATWQKVQHNDDIYMSSAKGIISTTWYSSLDAFNFSIPSNAIIQSISVKLLRFKTGRSNVIDKVLSLVWPSPDGTYAVGNAPNLAKTNYWPSTETEVIYTFSPSGTGSDGTPYNITASKINSPWFGFVFEFGCVRGGSGAVMNIDQALVTINYTLSTANNLQVEQFDNKVQVNASENGIYNLTVRNIMGQLLQRTIMKDPQGKTILLNSKCKGLCIITVENNKLRKTVKAFIK